MAEPKQPDPSPITPNIKIHREPSLQDQRLSDKIANAEKVILSVLGKPDLILALAPFGYNERELNRGLALFTDAQASFSDRQKALAVATSAKATRDLVLAAAKEEFTSFRQIVQANYSGADRTHLGASGTVPADIGVFTTTTNRAYATALKYPYLGVLANNGFTLDRIDTAIKAIEELTATDSASKTAQVEAKTATAQRNADGKALTAWMTRFRKVSRAALKKRPDLLAQIPK